MKKILSLVSLDVVLFALLAQHNVLNIPHFFRTFGRYEAFQNFFARHPWLVPKTMRYLGDEPLHWLAYAVVGLIVFLYILIEIFGGARRNERNLYFGVKLFLIFLMVVIVVASPMIANSIEDYLAGVKKGRTYQTTAEAAISHFTAGRNPYSQGYPIPRAGELKAFELKEGGIHNASPPVQKYYNRLPLSFIGPAVPSLIFKEVFGFYDQRMFHLLLLVAIMALILTLRTSRTVRLWLLIFVALNPFAFLYAGGYEALVLIFWLVLVLWLLGRKKLWAASVCAGLGALSHVYFLMIAPFILYYIIRKAVGDRRRNLRHALRLAVPALAIFALCIFIFLIADAQGLWNGLFEQTMRGEMASVNNAGIWQFLYYLGWIREMPDQLTLLIIWLLISAGVFYVLTRAYRRLDITFVTSGAMMVLFIYLLLSNFISQEITIALITLAGFNIVFVLTSREEEVLSVFSIPACVVFTFAVWNIYALPYAYEKFQRFENVMRDLGAWPYTLSAKLSPIVRNPAGSFLVFLVMIGLLAYLLFDVTKATSSRMRNILFAGKIACLTFMIVSAIIVPATTFVLHRRYIDPTDFNDGAVLIELGVRNLLEGKSPYSAGWTEFDNERQSALYRLLGMEKNPTGTVFAYPPGSFLTALPVYLAATATIGWYDQRFFNYLVLFLTIGTILFLDLRRPSRLILICVFFLIPTMQHSMCVGFTEPGLLLVLLLMVWALQRGRHGAAVVFLAIGVLLKQYLIFVLPFFTVYVCGIDGFSAAWRHRVSWMKTALRKLYPFVLVTLLAVIPFFLWSPDDTYRGLFEYWAKTFPIKGMDAMGGGAFLLYFGAVEKPTDYFPFFILMVVAGIPLLVLLVRRQFQDNSIAAVIENFTLLSLAFMMYMSRAFHRHHLALFTYLLVLAAVLRVEELLSKGSLKRKEKGVLREAQNL